MRVGSASVRKCIGRGSVVRVYNSSVDLLDFDISRTLFIVAKSAEVVPDLSHWEKGELGFDVKVATSVPYTEADFVVGTGIKVAYPQNCIWGLYLLPRSSTSIKVGLTLSNSCGVIDPSYRGEIRLPFHVVNATVFKSFCDAHEGVLPAGTRVAQCVLFPTYRPNCVLEFVSLDTVVIISDEIFEGWEDLLPSHRGSGGFGSTGF